MKQYELLELKKIYLSNIKFKRKTKLNHTQKAIIFLISFFMLIFFSYKIGYFIYTIKDIIKNRISKLNYNFSKENSESINITINITQEINITNINKNNTLLKKEDLLIPFSYSKNFEDIILNIFFNNITHGFYIDIGNFATKKMSTTKYFYLKGWNGINIKPLNDQYKELLNLRPKDININYYIGGKMKTKYFFQGFNETNITYNKISDIFNEYIPKNKDIHFCKIDLKDDVRKILLGYDFDNFRPKIFCIENNSTKTITYESYEYILNQNDFSFIYQYKNDRYYMDNKVIYLKERVKYIDGIIKEYINKNKER